MQGREAPRDFYRHSDLTSSSGEPPLPPLLLLLALLTGVTPLPPHGKHLSEPPFGEGLPFGDQALAVPHWGSTHFTPQPGPLQRRSRASEGRQWGLGFLQSCLHSLQEALLPPRRRDSDFDHFHPRSAGTYMVGASQDVLLIHQPRRRMTQVLQEQPCSGLAPRGHPGNPAQWE